MKKINLIIVMMSVMLCIPTIKGSAQQTLSSKAKVYFIDSISPQNLIKIYQALGRKATGKKVAVKLSTGEEGGHNYLNPQMIEPLVKLVKGTIIECNTAYPGSRTNVADHMKTAEDHGFTSIAKVDIMDAEGEMVLPVKVGRHLKADYVGDHLKNYDFVMVLSHFKGHAMGGFGGAIKNISIGIGSRNGKAYIHSAGKVKDANILWQNLPKQDDFLESMAESAKAVADYEGNHILYINVMNNLSVDCDCDSHPAAPKMGNVGILASLDPVALDQACVDMVMNSDDKGNKDLVERINTRHGTHTLYWGAVIGLGSRDYELVKLDSDK
jgi:uncharacterized protein